MSIPSDPSAAAGDNPTEPTPPLSPGDEAVPGTPGSGEDVCPACGGSGNVDGRTCTQCQGSGKVIVGIGGG